MTPIRMTVLSLMLSGFALHALAQTPAEHDEHHPAGGPDKPAVRAAPSAPPPDAMARMDQHMQAMQAMHEKMAAAKTPDARQALMGEHMKLMREGMSMMRSMRGGMGGGMGGMAGGKGRAMDIEIGHRMMEKRMDMMESMMQMMMDRMPPEAGR